MLNKRLLAVVCAIALAGCGNSDRSTTAPGVGEIEPPKKPTTVRRLAEITFSGSMQSILDAYTYGNAQLLNPRYIAEFVYRNDGQLSHEWITTYRTNLENEASVIPREGARSFEMIYDYDTGNPAKLTHYVQSNWGFWGDADSGQKNYDSNVEMVFQGNELAFSKEIFTRFYFDSDTQSWQSSDTRNVSRFDNQGGRTKKISTYLNVDEAVDLNSLTMPQYVDQYTYDTSGRVSYRAREYGDNILDTFVGESYTYTSTGALDTYEQEFLNNGVTAYRLTTFKHGVIDDPEYGEVFARVSATQFIDQFGNAFDEEVKVLLFEEADCVPSEDKPLGVQNPQWYSCFRQSIWAN